MVPKTILSGRFMESFMTLNTITFADMARREGWSFIGCEESFITIKLVWHGYLVLSLDICVHETPTETGLILYLSRLKLDCSLAFPAIVLAPASPVSTNKEASALILIHPSGGQLSIERHCHLARNSWSIWPLKPSSFSSGLQCPILLPDFHQSFFFWQCQCAVHIHGAVGKIVSNRSPQTQGSRSTRFKL